AVALAVGLQAAAQGGVAGIAESSVRALAKVVQVMPPRLRRRVDALRAMTVPATFGGSAPNTDPGVLTARAQACRDTERVEFGYTARSGERTDRHVEPLRLVSLGRRWYLVAYDLTRHDWRSFRVDRIDAPRRTGARFLPRTLPAADAAEFVRASTDQALGWDVEVLISAPADQIGTSSRCGWCRWAAAGTSSPTTSPGTTGAASGSTGSTHPAGPAPASCRARCPRRTPPSSCGRPPTRPSAGTWRC